MDFKEFADLLTLDVDAILAVASYLSVGIFALVQDLKVLGLVTDSGSLGKVTLLISAVFGAALVAGYYFPQVLPVITLLYSLIIGVSAAGLGYKYLASPILKKLFPGIPLSTDDLNE